MIKKEETLKDRLERLHQLREFGEEFR